MNRRTFLQALVIQSITIPRASYDRAEAEAKLMELLRKDIENMHVDLVNWPLRRKISQLAILVTREY